MLAEVAPVIQVNTWGTIATFGGVLISGLAFMFTVIRGINNDIKDSVEIINKDIKMKSDIEYVDDKFAALHHRVDDSNTEIETKVDNLTFTNYVNSQGAEIKKMSIQIQFLYENEIKKRNENN